MSLDLKDWRPPGEEAARERARRVAAEAFASRPARPRRRPLWLRTPALAAATAAAIAAVALTPPGDAVGKWFRDVIGAAPARPALTSLPAPGTVIVDGPRGTWLVYPDGSRRRVGRYTQATFSPRGLFLGVVRAGELAAVTPKGDVRWALSRPSVSDPDWSPSGLRVAYRSGAEVRVVYGDGALDRRVSPRAAPVAPAWRPHTDRHELAWVTPQGRVVVADTDRRRVLWRSNRHVPGITAIAWSPDGRQVLASGRDMLYLFDRHGTAGRFEAPGLMHAAWSPRGHRLAVVRRAPGGLSEVDVRRHVGHRTLVYAGPGGVDHVVWSPDGRWLLLDARAADQWIFVPVDGHGRLEAVGGIARQFTPDERGPGFASAVEWCCTK